MVDARREYVEELRMYLGKRVGNESRRVGLKRLATIAVACLGVSLLGGCSTAHWRTSKTVPGYVPPGQVTLILKFGPKVDPTADDGGNAAAMIDALSEELANRGLGMSIGELNTNAYPRLTLSILESYKGNRTLAYFTPAGNPAMIVSCELVMAEGRAPSFSGEIRGALIGSSAVDSGTGGEKIGRAIAEAIAEPTAFE